MKIVHLCVSCFYIDGYSYQENQLVAQMVRDGHDVTVIASTETFDDDRHVCYVEPGHYVGTDGATVIRLPYQNFGTAFLSRKIRKHTAVATLLADIKPDIIFFHGLSGWELFTVARYKKHNPKTSLFVDCHEDFNNSARSILSRYLLHGLYYKWIVSHTKQWFDRVYCISLECTKFAVEFYKIPIEKVEFLPLGGVILDDQSYAQVRSEERHRRGLSESERLYVQVGKIDSKKLLSRTLRCFSSVSDDNARLMIGGHVYDDQEEVLSDYLSRDSRISYIGWLDSIQLQALLCAADVYLQPGSQSSTMQAALCSRCAVVLDDVASHVPFVVGNGWLVKTEQDFEAALRSIAEGEVILDDLCRQSHSLATQMLGYKEIAGKIYAQHKTSTP